MASDNSAGLEDSPPAFRLGAGEVKEQKAAKKQKEKRNQSAKSGRNDGVYMDQVWAFVIALATGISVMFLPLDPQVHFVSAVSVTALYAALGCFLGWHKRLAAGEQFIDSCYFLGFVFTQAALGISFYKAYLDGGAFTADKLVPLVATALGASVVGLVAKVVLDQIVPDRSGTSERIIVKMETVSDAIDTEARKVVDSFASLAEYFKSISADVRSTLDIARDVSADTHTHRSELGATLGELRVSVDGLKERLASAGDDAVKGVRGLSGDLKAAVSYMAELKSIAQTISQIGGNAEGVLKQSEQAFSFASTAGRNVEVNVNKEIERLRTQLDGLSGRIEGDARRTVTENLGGLRSRIDNNIDQLGGELKRAETALAELVKEFDANLQSLRDDMQRDNGRRA